MSLETSLDLTAPLDRCREIIIADWVDLNQHMNVAYYMVVFDRATEVFLKQLGAGKAYTLSGAGTTFALEAVVKYERELHVGDVVRITTRLVDRNAKLLHLLHTMHHDASGERASTLEILLLHVDPRTRRGAPWPADIADRMDRIFAAHRGLASDSDAAFKIRIRR